MGKSGGLGGLVVSTLDFQVGYQGFKSHSCRDNHESKAAQIHVYNNSQCLYVPWVPGSVKNQHKNNKWENQFETKVKLMRFSLHLK